METRERGKQVWRRKSSSTQQEKWNALSFTVTDINTHWLKDLWVGNLRDLTMFEKLKETRFFHDTATVKVKYMGDDMVLISGVD